MRYVPVIVCCCLLCNVYCYVFDVCRAWPGGTFGAAAVVLCKRLGPALIDSTVV